MPFFKKSSRKRPRATLRKKSARGGRKSSAVSSAVKTYVKRTLHSAIENKCVQINYGNSFGNVLESPDFNAYPMCPSSTFWTIPQGVGQGGRIGNQIKVRKVMLNYIIRPTPYDALTNSIPCPQEVQLLLGYVKNTPSFAPIGGDINQLYQAGSTSIGPIGNLRDIISVINTDYWMIKKRWSHKVGFESYFGQGATGPVQQAGQLWANNDFKLNIVKRMDITKMCPSTCLFNDASATTNTKNLFLMYHCVYASGVTGNSVQLPMNIEYWIDFHYEDA